MSLVKELLKDYGSGCSIVGAFLNTKDCSSSEEIQRETKIEEQYIKLSLALLIQRRIVTYIVYDKTTFYKLDRTILIRRLFFNLYYSYVFDRFESHKAFLKILISGTSRIVSYKENLQPLIQLGIIKEISKRDINYGRDEDNRKREVKTFYIIDFDVLDRLLMDVYIMEYIKKRYSNSMKEVYKSICKCTIIDNRTVLNNLESTKLLVKDGLSYINDISNLDEYFKYLVNAGIIKKDFDGENSYKQNRSKCYDLLKLNEFNRMFKDSGTKRLLNLFYSLVSLEDSEVGKKSLLALSKVKNSLFVLHKYGCINLEYPTGGESARHPTVWRFNLEEFTGVFLKVIEKEIEKTLFCINLEWETGNILENESFLLDIAKLNYFTEKFFILHKKC